MNAYSELKVVEKRSLWIMALFIGVFVMLLVAVVMEVFLDKSTLLFLILAIMLWIAFVVGSTYWWFSWLVAANNYEKEFTDFVLRPLERLGGLIHNTPIDEVGVLKTLVNVESKCEELGISPPNRMSGTI